MFLRAWVEHITSLCGIAAKHHGVSRIACPAGANMTLQQVKTVSYCDRGTARGRHDLAVKTEYSRAKLSYMPSLSIWERRSAEILRGISQRHGLRKRKGKNMAHRCTLRLFYSEAGSHFTCRSFLWKRISCSSFFVLLE